MATSKKRPAAKKKTSKKTAAKKTAAKAAAARSEAPAKSAAEEKPAKTSALAPLEDIERIFEDFMHRRWPRPFRFEWPRWASEMPSLLERGAPLVDIVDREKEVVVKAELPGIEKDDLDVAVVDRTLTIKGMTRKEEKEEKDDYFRQEIRTGSLSRTVTLPADVNAAKATASFKDGVLELHFPKVRVSKRQQIKLGEG